jgi:hypothetical protein
MHVVWVHAQHAGGALPLATGAVGALGHFLMSQSVMFTAAHAVRLQGHLLGACARHWQHVPPQGVSAIIIHSGCRVATSRSLFGGVCLCAAEMGGGGTAAFPLWVPLNTRWQCLLGG